ncbi:hypothetical protein MPAR168_12960 [Methylorubrum populi]|uniref:HPt domain-containing protein n=1 Tax=Methylobacterium radiotolerans TaxID=31998 RepID=A0ABU7T7J3_9HYPH
MQDMPDDLDEATHAQVANLLGAPRAAEMLSLLKQTLVRLHVMSAAELSAPEGLALVHRLKSEAGLMGFARLSHACDVVDGCGVRGTVPPDDLQSLNEAVAAALVVVDTIGERRNRRDP